MVKQKLFFTSALGICMILGALNMYPVRAEIAQGDGDPNETAELLTDEKDDTAEDAVATITAEGDFLLPTYLLPVEGETASNDMIEVKEGDSTKTTTTKTTTTKTTTQELPIVLTSSTKTTSPALAEDINIDIDVASLSATAAGTTQSTSGRAPKQLGTGHTTGGTTTTTTSSRVTKTARTTPILIPLAPLPEAPAVEPTPDKYVRHVVPSEYADQFLSASAQGEKPGFIMPQEIKVSFYENATDFSGQTLKWIKAYAKSALADPRLVVEVRVSNQDPEIQYKRLALIRNTLMSNGLSSHQIRMIQTNREPNSLVLRTALKTDPKQTVVTKSTTGKKIEKQTISW